MRGTARLVDYFAVVAIGDDPSPFVSDHGDESSTDKSILDIVFNAECIDRVPIQSRTSFPTGIALFCLPLGARLTRIPPMPTYLSFVHTGGGGQHMYGCSLTFYEPLAPCQIDALRRRFGDEVEILERRTPLAEIFNPKCICVLSEMPFIEEFRECLGQLYRLSLSPMPLPLERFVGNVSELRSACHPGC